MANRVRVEQARRGAAGRGNAEDMVVVVAVDVVEVHRLADHNERAFVELAEGLPGFAIPPTGNSRATKSSAPPATETHESLIKRRVVREQSRSGRRFQPSRRALQHLPRIVVGGVIKSAVVA